MPTNQIPPLPDKDAWYWHGALAVPLLPAASGVNVLPARCLPLAGLRSPRYNSPVPAESHPEPVRVLFFGRLREIVGHAEHSVQLADGTPIESLFATFCAAHADLANFRSSMVASRNQEFVPWNTPLQPGDEVAFLPPVSGG